jgi:PAS domain S-box-containing protein
MEGLKLFIIEDDAVSLKLVRHMLENVLTKAPLDIECIESAIDLKSGIKKLTDKAYDVILLDLDLPDSKGVNTVIAISHSFPNLAIVVITGAYEDGLGLKAVSAGAEDYLLKGNFDIVMLNKAITYAYERKQTERFLRVSEEKYKLLVEHLKDVVIRISIDGTIEYASPVISEFAGYKPEEFMGTKIDDYFTNIHEVKKVHEVIYRIIFDRTEMTEEFLFMPKNKRAFWVEMTGKPITNESDIITVQCVMRNVSERKQAEEKLRAAYDELKGTQAQLIQSEKLAALGSFSSGIAHEVKNPLGIILGGIEYLEEVLPEKSHDVADAISKIKDSTLRADKIICDLLSYARPSALVFEKICIKKLLEETIALLQYRKAFRFIQLRKIIPNDSLWIEADRNQLQQVLVNVLMNAVEAVEKDGILTIGIIERICPQIDKKKVSCVIEIHDNGIGIPESDIEKVFEPFFTTKRDTKGTGLGLSMAKIIVTNHGGFMSIKSAPKKGTTVLMALPISGEDV